MLAIDNVSLFSGCLGFFPPVSFLVIVVASETFVSRDASARRVHPRYQRRNEASRALALLGASGKLMHFHVVVVRLYAWAREEAYRTG